jgi:hypothetical protein
MSAILGETLSVITADVDWPGDSRVPSLFQVIVMGPFELLGLQLEVVMLSARDTPVPVFLI